MSTRRASRIAPRFTAALVGAFLTAACTCAYAADPAGVASSTGTAAAYASTPFAFAASADEPFDAVLSPGSSPNFAALADGNVVIPPDVTGAVGLSYLMVATEADVQVHDKSGVVIGSMTEATFWSPVSSGAVVSYPRIVYDTIQDRWVFCALAYGAGATSRLLLAASANSNPTGSWNLYAVDIDPNNDVRGYLPFLGFNTGAIVVQVNTYSVTNDLFAGSQAYAFDPSTVYGGAPAIYRLFTPDPATYGGPQVPAITYDNYGVQLFAQMWTGDDGDGAGYLRLWALGGASFDTATLAPGPFVGPLPPWDNYTASANAAPQLGTSNKVYLGDSWMLSVVYRNGAVWAAHPVFLPESAPTRSAVQWLQIDPANGDVLQGSRIDDVDDASPQMFYAFPSIAVNATDDVLIGYSRFSSQQYPSANYSFRSASDPLSTLRDDRVLKAGDAPTSSLTPVGPTCGGTTAQQPSIPRTIRRCGPCKSTPQRRRAGLIDGAHGGGRSSSRQRCRPRHRPARPPHPR